MFIYLDIYKFIFNIYPEYDLADLFKKKFSHYNPENPPEFKFSTSIKEEELND